MRNLRRTGLPNSKPKPKPVPEPKPEPQRGNLRIVYFNNQKNEGKIFITPENQEVIQKNCQWIAANPDVQIQLEGHSYQEATNEANLYVGERLVEKVYDYLVHLGVNACREISMTSFGPECGKSQPSDLCRPSLDVSIQLGETAKNNLDRVVFTEL